jgi:hypothetical protein
MWAGLQGTVCLWAWLAAHPWVATPGSDVLQQYFCSGCVLQECTAVSYFLDWRLCPAFFLFEMRQRQQQQQQQ